MSHPLTIHVSALQTQEDVGALGVLVPRRPTQALVLLNVHPALGVKRVLHPHILRHQPLPQLQLFPALENRKTGACVLAATAVITLDSFPQLQLFPALKTGKMLLCTCCNSSEHTRQSSNWCDISTVVKRFRKNQSANHHNQSDSLYGHLYYY